MQRCVVFLGFTTACGRCFRHIEASSFSFSFQDDFLSQNFKILKIFFAIDLLGYMREYKIHPLVFMCVNHITRLIVHVHIKTTCSARKWFYFTQNIAKSFLPVSKNVSHTKYVCHIIRYFFSSFYCKPVHLYTLHVYMWCNNVKNT